MLGKRLVFLSLMFGALIFSVFLSMLNNSSAATLPIESDDKVSSNQNLSVFDPGYLVPCGRLSGSEEEVGLCRLCHFFVLAQRIVNYIFFIMIIAAILVITISGILYLVSSGSPGLVGRAKNMLKLALIGVALALLAWLIINYILIIIAAKPGFGIKRVEVKGWNIFEIECEIRPYDNEYFEEIEADEGSPDDPPDATPGYYYKCGGGEIGCQAMEGGDPNLSNTYETLGQCRANCEIAGTKSQCDSLPNAQCASQDCSAINGFEVDGICSGSGEVCCKKAQKLYKCSSAFNCDQVASGGALLSECQKSCQAPITEGGLMSEQEARQKLAAAGIPVNHAACSYVGQKGCTNLDQIPERVIDNLLKLKGMGHNFTVTGGTEYWLHQTHGPGKPIVDIVPNKSGSWEDVKKDLRGMGAYVKEHDPRHLHIVFK